MQPPSLAIVSMALLALTVAGCGFLSGPTYHFEDEGQLCLGGPSYFGAHEEFEVEPGEPIEISVIFDDCRSSSCTDFHESHCSIEKDGQTLTVTSQGSLTDTSSRIGRTACTDDCFMYSTTCKGPELEEGTYTLRHGEDIYELEIAEGETVPKCYGE